eukprot:1740483-Alexandrium_andersonii.AAC.1
MLLYTAVAPLLGIPPMQRRARQFSHAWAPGSAEGSATTASPRAGHWPNGWAPPPAPHSSA